MRVEISSIDEPSIYRLGVASSIIFKGRLSKVSSKRAIGNPSGGLFELHKT